MILAAFLASAELPNWDVIDGSDAPVATSTAGFSKAVLKVNDGYCAGACSFPATEPFCGYYNVGFLDTCPVGYNPLAPTLYPEISGSDHDEGCLSALRPLTRDYI